MATLLAGVKAGQLHQGHFNANAYNYLEVRGFFSRINMPFIQMDIGECARACLRQARFARRSRTYEPSRPRGHRGGGSVRREGLEGAGRRGRGPRRCGVLVKA